MPLRGTRMKPLVKLVSSATRTRVVMTRGPERLLRANLPPLSQVKHERAVTSLLDALSMWVDEALCVALSAADLESCFRLGLTDEMYAGARSVFYAVEVAALRRRRGPGPSLGAEPTDARQLSLLGRPGGAR